MITTEQIAHRLVELCRNGKIEEAKQELFAAGIKSIEPVAGILPIEVEGMEAIKKKAELFISHVENFYGNIISEPLVAGAYFSVSWQSDLQMKGAERKINQQICVYKTGNGKIISEEFFY